MRETSVRSCRRTPAASASLRSARTSRAGWTVAPSRKKTPRRNAGEEQRRDSSSAEERYRLLLDAELARGGDRAVEDRVLRLRRRHAQQPTLAEPDVVLQGAHGRDRPIRRPRDRESPLGAEHVAEAGEARPVAVEEAAVPPARPDPATRSLEHDDVERRVTPLQLESPSRGP